MLIEMISRPQQLYQHKGSTTIIATKRMRSKVSLGKKATYLCVKPFPPQQLGASLDLPPILCTRASGTPRYKSTRSSRKVGAVCVCTKQTGASDVGGNLGGGEGLCTVSWRRGDKLGGGGGLVQAKRGER